MGEFESASAWLAATISLCTRKILESAKLSTEESSPESNPTLASTPENGKAVRPTDGSNSDVHDHPDDGIDVMGMKVAEQQKQEVLSPMDTYEMSDSGSDSESDESDYYESDYYEEEHHHKRVPKWAQPSNLAPAVEKQFMDGPGRIDPDAIFPEVSTCDLASVFDKKKKARYRKRTSSGNWTKDGVTAQENLVYKRSMGFAK